MDGYEKYAALDPRIPDLVDKAKRLGAEREPDWQTWNQLASEARALVGMGRQTPGEPAFEVVRQPEGTMQVGDLVEAAVRQEAIRSRIVERMGEEEADRHRELSGYLAHDAVMKRLEVAYWGPRGVGG